MATRILQDDDLSEKEKLQKLLGMEFLKFGVGAQGNFKLIDFLSKKENLKELVKFAVAVPQDPDNHEESYK